MKKLLLAVTIILLFLIGYLRVGRPARQALGEPFRLGRQHTQVADINKACTKTASKDGFGLYVISHSLSLVNQTGSILVNCRLQIIGGGKLEVKNSHIMTKKLEILDVQPGKQPSTVSISNSSLQSSSGGLQIRLKNGHSRASISSSQLDYPLSVGVSVGKSGDEQASLVVASSKITSVGPNSEDIVLVSTGKANFTGNTFSLFSQERVVLLVAPICHASNNIGGNSSCISS